jgi:urease accessory protein
MSIHPMLLLLADGRFPSGGSANSAGAESAIRYGDIVDAISMERYLRGRLWTSGLTDAAFAARACSAAGHEAPSLGDVVDALDHEYDARTASPRLRSVSRQLGRQLCRSARAVWPHPALLTAVDRAGGCHHPVVLGLATSAAGGGASDAAVLVLHQMSSAVSTAAVRMLGLDPLAASATQARVAADLGEIMTDVDRWAAADPADLPARTGTLTDVLAEQHGRWDARLFVA